MTKENEEDIKVNRRSTDKVYFESPFVQSVYDSIDFLRDETKNILRDLDSNEFKQSIDEFDMEDFGEKTADHFSDIFDDLSQIRSKIINSDDLPEFVRDYSKKSLLSQYESFDKFLEEWEASDQKKEIVEALKEK